MKKKIEKKCDVCGSIVKTTEYGGGKCKKCGWIDDPHQREYPDCTNCGNLISLNKAKIFWREGKKFFPDYDEFIDMMNRGFEFEFKMRNKTYNIAFYDDKHWGFYCYETDETQLFESVNAFDETATVDGVPLRDCWQDLTYIDYD